MINPLLFALNVAPAFKYAFKASHIYTLGEKSVLFKGKIQEVIRLFEPKRSS